ncbi:MAG: response regulator [Betaproteobacteria bacterium]
MARTQNGDLQMKTSESDGTTLTLQLREWNGAVISSSGENRNTFSTANFKEKLPALHVLIVDDDPNNTLIMKMFLPSPPLIVSIAGNGVEALQSCKDVRPDIIFMDLEMPVMNGYEAIKEIRLLQNRQGELPSFVVAFSAHDDEMSRMRSLDLGFDQHLSKPSSQAEIFALIASRNLPIVESEQVVKRQVEAVVWVDPDIKDIIPGFIASRLVLLLETKKIIEEKNRENLRQLMHKLKGSFMLYGFKWAAEACRKIEDTHETIDFFTVNVQIEAIEQHLLNAEIRFRDHSTLNLS